MAYDRYNKNTTKRKVLSLDDNEIDGDDIKPVIAALDKYITENTKGKRVTPINGNRAHELHPSSFPYCGLQHVHEIFKNGGIPTTQEIDYFGMYYTGLGSFKHELMQDWLGKGKQLVGDWLCKNRYRKKKPCKGERKTSVYASCPKCGGDMDYHELGIKFGKHTHGHLDGIFLWKGKYYIIDYKTTGQYKLFQHKSGKAVCFPFGYNKAQIESYQYYIEKQYGIKIAGWILIYISRDKSFRDYVSVGELFTKENRKRISKTVKKYDNDFDIAIKAKTYNDIIPLIEEKPCSCRSDYLNNFHNEYDPCPLAKVCFNPKKLEETMQKVAKNMGKTKKVKEKA